MKNTFDRQNVVEVFNDALGDWKHCIKQRDILIGDWVGFLSGRDCKYGILGEEKIITQDRFGSQTG